MTSNWNGLGWYALARRLGVLALLYSMLAGTVHGQAVPVAPAAADAKNILFLYSYGYGGKGVEVFNDSFRNTMTDAGFSISNVFAEYLDLERNKADPQYRQRLLELLQRKYSERQIDLIITGQQPALEFLLNEGAQIAPEAPAITALAPAPTSAQAGARRIVSHSAGFDIKGTLQYAMELFPATKRMVFASGSSDPDKALALAAAASASAWQGKLELEFTYDLSLDDMLRRLASLPGASIIVFTQYNRDIQGRIGVAYEVERMIVKSANAPVFGFYDFNLYNGGIGGSVLGVKKLGESTAQLALDLLRGKLQLTQQVTSIKSDPFPIFDWGQIKRWGGDPSRLPSNTVFVNRVPTFWEQYRTYVIGLAVFVLGQLFLIIALLVNKKQRARAERLLLESEENLAITLHSIGDAVIATDVRGRVTRMNPVAERLTGWTFKDASKHPLSEVFRIVGASSREPVPDPAGLVMSTGKVVGLVNHTMLLARGGQEYQIADSAAPIRNASGEIVGVVLVFSDVSGKYQNEEALRQREEQYRTLIENTGEGIGFVDPAERFTFANPAAEAIFGVPTGGLLGRSLRDFTSAQQFKVFSEQSSRYRPGEKSNYEIQISLPDGAKRDLLLTAVPRFGREGEYAGAFGVFRDITDRIQHELSLRRTQELLALAQRASRSGAWDWDMVSGQLVWSDELFHLFGLSCATTAASFDAWRNAIHPEDLQMAETNIGNAIRDHRPLFNQYRIVLPDGMLRWIAAYGDIVYDAQDQPVRMTGLCLDVTDTKKSEELILQSEERFRALANLSSDWYWEQDESLRFTSMSKPNTGHADIELNTFLGHTRREAPDVAWDEPELTQLEAITQARQPFRDFAIGRVYRNGDKRYVSMSGEPMFDATGAFKGYRGVGSDITERKVAEYSLRQSEERWQFAIEGAGDGLWDWNVQTGEAFFSRRYKEMLGFGEDEVGNTSDEWSKRIHPEDAPRVMAALQPYMDGKPGSAPVEFRMLCKDGRWQWTLGRGVIVSRDADGRPSRMIGTNSDITERKQAEAIDSFLAQAGSAPDAEPFFAALARFLAQSLQMDYICIDRLEGDKLNATTLAVWHDGHFEDNLTYALSDTPCGDVVGQKVCCFPASVCQFFPNDAALQELRAESYIGVTLWSHTGQPIGLIAAIGRRQLSNRRLAEATLARVVVRASGELERLNAEAAVRESEARFRTVVEVIPDAIVLHRGGKLAFANPAAIQMFGAGAERDLIGKPILELVHPDFQEIARQRIELGAEQAMPVPRIEERYVKLDGTGFDVEVQGRRIEVAGVPAVLAVMHDITARKQADAKLQLAANVFGHAREGIVITNAGGTIIDVNEAFTRITGYQPDEALGQNPSMLKSDRQDKAFYEVMWRELAEQGHWSGELWNRRKDGELFAELLTISLVRDAEGAVQQYVGLFSDITSIKEHQSKLEHIAHFDALTNLPNRVLLSDRLQQAMAQAQRRNQQVAVVYLDLDGFKAINDQHGHEAGDQVLITLAQRLKQALREGDSLARLGGDEFVAVLIDLEDMAASVPMLTRLLLACSQPVRLGDLSLQVSASLGVTAYPQAQDIDADQLLRQADQAMYQAKVAGKNRYHIFDATQDSSIRGHHESLLRIRLALEMSEFVLHYQPKVNMRTGQIVGAEALIRWQHPDKGLLAPAVFLPVVEDHALAVSIGEWVIDTALAQMELWQSAGLDFGVSVNIGARQLQQSDFVDRLKLILARHPHVNPASLELEVLETSALEDIAQVSEVIEACAAIGVMFALDDFGTGYSSLTYLKRLRVETLKIDQSFVRDMLEDQDDLSILEGIIGLAASFKRQVIAEGVETVAHGSLLLLLGCELAQGFVIARPMPAEQLPQWAAEWRADPDPGQGLSHEQTSRFFGPWARC